MSTDTETSPRTDTDEGPSLRERVTKAVDEFSRVAVPFWLFGLILTSTYVLLITWPITDASTAVVCSSPRAAVGENTNDGTNNDGTDNDGANTNRNTVRQRNPFEDAVIYLVSYCPPESSVDNKADERSEDPPGKLRQPDVDEDSDDHTSDEENADPFSDWTVPRQQNALFLAVLAAGVIGGSVYSLRVHTRHVGTGAYHPRWWQWNASRPFLSGALAILFFFLIRAGFVEDGKLSGLKPEGFIAIAGLVGLFTDEAWAKIRHVSEAVFAPANPRRSEDDPSGRS